MNFLEQYISMSTLITSAVTLMVTALATLLKTKSFVNFLDKKILNGTPRKINAKDLLLINNYFKSDELKINKIIKKTPVLSIVKYFNCNEVVDNLDHVKAQRFHDEQTSQGFPDDPHIFVLPKTELENLDDNDEQVLDAYAISQYSLLRSLPIKIKNRLLVVGANNLVFSSDSKKFIFHHRGDLAETRSRTLHGFGGGYMPYWEGGNKTNSVRRDDCKNLEYTAMRELHEESGLLSLDHVPSFICVLEEKHTYHSDGKFGYLTFFYTTKAQEQSLKKYSGDAKEGARKEILINFNNIKNIIFHKKISNIETHPQLRCMLTIWFFSGCPGLHFWRRIVLSNFLTRRKLRYLLAVN